MLSFNDSQAAPYVNPIPDEDLDLSWQFVDPVGTRLEHGRALVALLCSLRATRWIGISFARLRLYWLAEAIDWAINKARPKLSHLVPDTTGPSRPPT